MKITFFTVWALLICALLKGQNTEIDWYSESDNNGIIIQNSFPKGGPYDGPTVQHFNYSSLVFFTRVVNETDKPIELKMNFASDSIAIPDSPGTFMKLFLPQDTMSFDKERLYNYGVRHLKSFNNSTNFYTVLQAKESCLFYVVTIFYQTKKEYRNQDRGGNRAELILDGEELLYKMDPQIKSMPCGTIKFAN